MATTACTDGSRATRGRASSLVLLLALVLCAAPARAADPLLMFVLGFAKNLIDSAIERDAAAKPATVVIPTPLPAQKLPSNMDENDLRALVEESFGYLNTSQRAELLGGLQKTLADPANGAYRDVIVAQFVGVARQVSFTHRQLDRLSADDKRLLAERFAENFRGLSPEQQHTLTEQLRTRSLPLPADLNDMMLSALASAR